LTSSGPCLQLYTRARSRINYCPRKPTNIGTRSRSRSPSRDRSTKRVPVHVIFTTLAPCFTTDKYGSVTIQRTACVRSVRDFTVFNRGRRSTQLADRSAS
jgi:hypothetical protein